MLVSPTLDEPGAGLPWYETLYLRYVTFPNYVRTMTWHSGVELFHEEGQNIKALIELLNNDQLLTPVLIDRLRGLEDSSRFWSPVMVLEHLVIVGRELKDIIISLNEEKVPNKDLDIADVKPSDKTGTEIIGRFNGFQDEFITVMSDERYHRSSVMKFDHPWLGPLNSFQWLCLAAGHQYLHRTQIRKILKK